MNENKNETKISKIIEFKLNDINYELAEMVACLIICCFGI